jgi:hypothetical protein
MWFCQRFCSKTHPIFGHASNIKMKSLFCGHFCNLGASRGDLPGGILGLKPQLPPGNLLFDPALFAFAHQREVD